MYSLQVWNEQNYEYVISLLSCAAGGNYKLTGNEINVEQYCIVGSKSWRNKLKVYSRKWLKYKFKGFVVKIYCEDDGNTFITSSLSYRYNLKFKII